MQSMYIYTTYIYIYIHLNTNIVINAKITVTIIIIIVFARTCRFTGGRVAGGERAASPKVFFCNVNLNKHQNFIAI